MKIKIVEKGKIPPVGLQAKRKKTKHPGDTSWVQIAGSLKKINKEDLCSMQQANTREGAPSTSQLSH
jgi:hypothetical protein